MEKKCNSVYKNSRLSACITKNIASGFLDVSERQLSNYESLECIPSDGIVLKMVELYDRPQLKIDHLFESSLIFKNTFELYDLDFPLSILLIEKNIDDLERVLPIVIKELARFKNLDDDVKNKLFKSVNELMNTAICIMRNCIKKECNP